MKSRSETPYDRYLGLLNKTTIALLLVLALAGAPSLAYFWLAGASITAWALIAAATNA